MNSDAGAVRPADRDDLPAIQDLHCAAFGGDGEARLVARLSETAAPLVSLVAEQDGRIAGHILLSPVDLEPAVPLRLMGLGPLAVTPELQRRGIGSALVRAGIAHCRKLGADAIVVIGHAGYFPRFGFRPAVDFDLACHRDVPVEAFMALELTSHCLQHVRGIVHFPAAFDGL